MRKFALLPALCALLLDGCVIAPIAPPVAPPASARDEVRAFTELVNEHRKKVGCRPLTWVSAVAVVAQRHSEEMAALGFFSHTNLQGETPFARLRKAGIQYTMAAENIAEGQRTAEQVLASWLSSRGHRRNIEDCSFRQHGIGMEQNRWTHMFVTLR